VTGPSPFSYLSKCHYSSRYDWLALPHNVTSAPNEAVARMSAVITIFYLTKSLRQVTLIGNYGRLLDENTGSASIWVQTTKWNLLILVLPTELVVFRPFVASLTGAMGC
jgi:hypothetical protein